MSLEKNTNNDKLCEECGREEIEILYRISEALNQSMDLREILGFVLKTMANHMGMLRGTLTILNRETGKITIEEAYGLSHSQQAKGRYKLGEGVTGKVVQTGEVAYVKNISKEPLFLNKTGSREDVEKKDISFICVPIKLRQEVIGTLSADKLFDESISFEEDVRMLTIIASMIANALHLRQIANEKMKKIEQENKRLKEELKSKFQPKNIIGKSNAMIGVYELISKVSKSNTTVLIRGESGVGKELVAAALHYQSIRKNSPFVKVNVSALPFNLIESELFGHEKGAFTGAHMQKKGKFELAEGGTIFLDEIGDVPLAVQVKLLRVLQEKEIERVGGNRRIKIDVRIIFATNRDLEKMIKEGRFREDFYYRINVFPIHVPPLRDRKTDILLLLNYFVEKIVKETGKRINHISPTFTDTLMNYHWPGNVRELENCIERAVLLSNDGVLHLYHLPPTLQNIKGGFHKETTGSLQKSLDQLERIMIEDALRSCKGNMAKASKILGISERIMGLRVKKYELNPKNFKFHE